MASLIQYIGSYNSKDLMQILDDQIIDSQAYMPVLPAVIIVPEVCISGDNWLAIGEGPPANMCVSIAKSQL